MILCEILMNLFSNSDLSDLSKFPANKTVIQTNVFIFLDFSQYIQLIQQYILYRFEFYNYISQLFIVRKKAETVKYDCDIKKKILTVKNLMMLYQKDTEKLQSR